MPRTAKPIQPTEEKQPPLFTPEQLPAMPALVAAAKSYVHTGKTTCKNEERAQAIVTTYLETGSLLATSKRLHCHPLTIKNVLKVFEEAGKLDDLKQRLSNKLGMVAELATDQMGEALEAGKVPANVLPIMLGVVLDKKAQLDGEPTQRIAIEAAEPTTAGHVLDYLRSKGLPAPAIDVESTATPAEPAKTEASL